MSTSGSTHVERTQGSTRNDVRDAFNAPDHSDWSEGSGFEDFCYLCLHVPTHTCTHTHMQICTHMTHHLMQVISEVTVTDVKQLSPTTKGFTLQAYNKKLSFKPGQW